MCNLALGFFVQAVDLLLFELQYFVHLIFTVENVVLQQLCNFGSRNLVFRDKFVFGYRLVEMHLNKSILGELVLGSVRHPQHFKLKRVGLMEFELHLFK